MANYKNLIRMESTDHVPGVPYVKEGINLCRLPGGLTCMGCCGLDFAPQLGKDAKRAFIRSLLKSTHEFRTASDKQAYKGLYPSYDLHDCGLCRRLVIDDGEADGLDEDALVQRKHLDMLCPLHPAQNHGEELRTGECDHDFMCATQRRFMGKWDETTRRDFVEFVMKRDMDWFTYSVRMHDDSLLKEFLLYKGQSGGDTHGI